MFYENHFHLNRSARSIAVIFNPQKYRDSPSDEERLLPGLSSPWIAALFFGTSVMIVSVIHNAIKFIAEFGTVMINMNPSRSVIRSHRFDFHGYVVPTYLAGLKRSIPSIYWIIRPKCSENEGVWVNCRFAISLVLFDRLSATNQ